MKRKLLVSLFSAAALCACIGAGCAVEPTESELNGIKNFGFENPAHENEYLSRYATDEGFEIDGVLSENVWQENGTAFTFEHESSTAENPVTMTSKSYLGEKGVYLALSVKDTAVYYSPDRKASGNTSVEVYLGAFGKTEWDGNSFRISVVPTGNESCTTEMRTYRTKKAAFTGDTDTLKAEWSLWYKAHKAACRVNGAGINTGFNEGYDVELFVPYESLGIEQKPEAVQYMTAFYHVESEATNADSVWTKCDQNVATTSLGGWLVATNDAIGYYSEMADQIFAEKDGYMTIDGKLNESVWHAENALTYRPKNAAYGTDASVSTIAHLSDLGVYVGMTVKDSKVYATGARNVKFNSGVELWVQSADAETVNEKSVQLRVDALGNVSKWQGTGATDGSAFAEKYFPSISAVTLLGCEKVNGAVASDTAEGFCVEVFIPWSSLGMNEKPNSVAVYPSYVHAGNNTNTNNTTNEYWQYFQLASQTAARTQSKSAFLRLTDGDFEGALITESFAFNADDLQQDGSYKTRFDLIKEYRPAPASQKLDSIAVTDAVCEEEGISITHLGEGEYEIVFSSQAVLACANGKEFTLRSGALSATATAQYLPVFFDGEVNDSEGYAPPYSFVTQDSGGKYNEITVNAKPVSAGMVLAITMRSSYINYQTTELGNGNNGGGIEIMMASTPSATDTNGIWWRMFADGSARCVRDLTKGAPLNERTKTPLGSSSYAVGLTPVDAENPAEGYSRMTAEFFIPYAAVGAAGAEDFYFVVGAVGTKVSDNSSLAIRWADGSAVAKPADALWTSAASAGANRLQDQTVTVTSEEGGCSFKVKTSVGEYTYAKGLNFVGGGTVAEGVFGTYTCTLTQPATLTATRGGQTVTVTVVYNAALSLDGTVNDGEYTGHFTYRIGGTGIGKDANDYADIKVSYYLSSSALYLAFEATENTAKTLTNTGANTNQGSAGMDFVVASAENKASYYRAYASGLMRKKSVATIATGSFGAPAAPAAENFMRGSHTVEAGQTQSGITQWAMEWKIEFSAHGVSSADDLRFLFGWINANNADRFYGKLTGQTNAITSYGEYFSLADIIALAEEQAGA